MSTHTSDLNAQNSGYKSLADILPPPQSNVSPDNDESWSSVPEPVSNGPSSWFSKGASSLELSLSDDAKPGSMKSLLRLIEAQIRGEGPVDFLLLNAVLDAIKNQNGIGIDDRKFLLEKILVFLSRVPPGSTIGTQVEHFLIDLLYKDLPHPPSTYLGRVAAPIPPTNRALGLNFAYREADGSNNNPLMPHLGAAHTPYARSVASSHVAPVSTLPDPAIVFDTLLRRDKDVEHPTGLSSLFFAFANLIIHTLFRTNRHDWSINDTSSYLDLSPLYGVDEESQNLVRRHDGTGRLWNDTFADARLLAMPPSVAALLIVFSRNHNFIATRILEINEGGTYKSRPTSAEVGPQDDEIFNRARLVNCGTFMQVIMRDYVGAILKMIPELSAWHLQPFDEFRGSDHELTPRGQGNVCSVEFNLLYRWHATTSATDSKWLETLWKNLFKGKSPDEASVEDFGKAMGGLDKLFGKDPRTWPVGGLPRDEKTGKFDDGALAKFLQDATADSANAFRARGTPAVFKVIEVLGTLQARKWGVCSLNEFRQFLALKPYKSFKEWNPNPEIYMAAEKLYHHIDNLELYVGMQAEESRPSIPGSGLCSGFTMSRAILADAVALIRGDRFLTVEYTPFNLTSWGFRDAQTDDDNGSFGGMLTKLLLRTLPRHYHTGSAYAHFPFMVPRRMREDMLSKKPDMVKQYIWYRPKPLPPITTVDSYSAVVQVATDSTKFGLPYEIPAANLTKGYGFYFTSSDNSKARGDKVMIERALFSTGAIAEHTKFYHDVTKELIADKSITFVGTATKTVDIVAHVINYIPVHWVATRVAGLSLQTKEVPHGKYNEQQLYDFLTILFKYTYLNPDSVNTWLLEKHARLHAERLLGDIKKKVEECSSFFSVRGLADALSSFVNRNAEQESSEAFLRHLCETNSDREPVELAYNVFGVVVNSVANWAHAMTHVVNFYLDDVRKTEKEAIVSLSLSPLSVESERCLIGYVKEALRLDPPIAGVFRNVRADIEVSGSRLHSGQTVVANLTSAKLDQGHFGVDASAVNINRTQGASPLDFVVGAHTSLDETFSEKTMAHALRAIYSKKNLRRAAGASGQLTRFTTDICGTPQKLYIDSKGKVSRWPQSLLVQYDI